MIFLGMMLIGVYTLALGVAFHSRKGIEAAYAQGQRDALKEAIEAARERGDVAVLVAPNGLMPMAQVRAQAAHQIEMDLRAQLAAIR